MTTIHALPDEAVRAADLADAIEAGAKELADYIRANPGITLPTPVWNIPVSGRDRTEKLANLAAIAAEYGTEDKDGPHGMRIMVAEFGWLRIEAHVNPSDMAKRIIAAQDGAKAAAA